VLTEFKSPPRLWALRLFCRVKYFQRFYAVRVGGFAGWRDWLASDAPFPLVLFGNHETWWDGLLDFSLGERYGLDTRMMMEEKNLRRYCFFQGCGCFGVDLESRRGRGESLLHAVRLLREGAPRRCVILYPHGRLVHDWEQPKPRFEGGLERVLARAPEATALPVWRRFIFGKHELPEVEIQLGEPLVPRAARTSADLEAALEATAARLADRLRSADETGVEYLARRRLFLLGET